MGFRTARSFANGTTLITGHDGGVVRFWQVAQDALIEQDPVKPQPAIIGSPNFPTVSPHGPAIAFPTDDAQVRVWRFGGGTPIEATFLGDSPPKGRAFAVTRDGKTLATGG